MFQASADWRSGHPGAVVGFVCLSGLQNPASAPDLEAAKARLEDALRRQWPDRETIKADPVMAAYQAYYKRFKKTYHVLNQVESVALKGRSLPRVAALVEAMFMAELKNRLLTAGHDADTLAFPLTVRLVGENDSYVLLNGQTQTAKPGDMGIADGQGLVSTIVHGPDMRTMIRAETTRAVFTVYAPPGVGQDLVSAHLQDIAAFSRLVSPAAQLDALTVLVAG